jgi:hypothetical protein
MLDDRSAATAVSIPIFVTVFETIGDGFHRAVNATWHSIDFKVSHPLR